MTGDLLDRYELLDVLGEGGFGRVHRAIQRATGQRVAVKTLILNAVGQDTSHHKERFLREMKLIGRLRSSHVVRLLDAGFDGDNPFMVLELVEGESLSAILARGPLPPSDTRRLVSQVLEAVAEAHDLGIVHRDLKPDNIMVTGSGLRSSAKVLDFGIAGIQESFKDSLHVTVTQFGQVCGTPPYMAPEQLNAFSEARVESDVYALGLIMLECLTGRQAVTGTNLVDIARKQMTEPVAIPPPIRASGFGSVIVRACAKDPVERYRTASEMLEAVHRIASDEALLLTTGNLGHLRENISATADLVVLQPPASTPDQSPAEVVEEAPAPDPERRLRGVVLGMAVAVVLALGVALVVALAGEADRPASPPSAEVAEPSDPVVTPPPPERAASNTPAMPSAEALHAQAVEDGLRRGNDAMAAARFAEAEAAFAEVLAREPAALEASLGRAESVAAQQRCDEALDQLEVIAPRLDPSDSLHARYLMTSATCHASAGRVDVARPLLERLVAEHPEDRAAAGARIALAAMDAAGNPASAALTEETNPGARRRRARRRAAEGTVGASATTAAGNDEPTRVQTWQSAPPID